MDCLNAEQLKALIGTGKKIFWHPNYKFEQNKENYQMENMEVIAVRPVGYFYEVVTNPDIYPSNKGGGMKINADGTGLCSKLPMLILVENCSVQQSIPAPRNNDGRTTCFWCNVPTQLRGGGAYNVCPKCGK